jgi:hypothetical protein
MKQTRFLLLMLSIVTTLAIISCGPSIKVIAIWQNKEKMPAQPIKSVFILALTNSMELKSSLENDLAAAAEARGIKAYRSIDVMGPVAIKDVAPVKEAFVKKLNELKCETIFTIALIDEKSETKYVPGSTVMYAPYGYGGYAGYGGYGAYGMYGGFGGYYGYSTTMMSTPGYYETDKTYFIEGKLFDVQTEELLMSAQSKASNPGNIQKASKQYTQTLMEEVNKLRPVKK